MKTLNTIQTLSKIGKVLSKIISICCIIGAVGCGVGSHVHFHVSAVQVWGGVQGEQRK